MVSDQLSVLFKVRKSTRPFKWNILVAKNKVMYKPPVFRTIGIEPYLIAVSWVSPHGSKIEGTRMKSAPAYI